MPVRPTQTMPRCKLCQSPHRSDIEALLEKRSMGEKDEAGRRFNFDYVKELVEGQYGIANLTQENVKIHWKKHCEVITAEVEVAQKERRQVVLREVAEPANVDAYLDKIIQLSEADLDARMEVEGNSGVTIDQGLKAVQIKSARRQAEAENKLFKSIGAGMAGAFKGLIEKEKGELPPADIELEAEEAEIAE